MKRTLTALAGITLPFMLHAAEGPIQDNSFLVEEAYNQEEGVVQHINTFQRLRDSRDWFYTFTQEWPVGGITHQFSYTVPFAKIAESPDGKAGVGDAALNYRYQLLGDGEARLAIAPRLSLILPSGNEKQGRGTGAIGYQALVPMSLVLTKELVTHSNAGFTWTPRARDAQGNRADTTSWNVGQSLVWLAHQRVNAMLEWIYSRGEEVSGPGQTAKTRASFLSPGVRWSYDFPSGLQIVPGIAFPIGVGASRGERSVFLYLSFEHPFKALAEKK